MAHERQSWLDSGRVFQVKNLKTLLVVPSLRKVDAKLTGKRNSYSHGARPVHLIITMIKWIRTSRLSAKTLSALYQGWNFTSQLPAYHSAEA